MQRDSKLLGEGQDSELEARGLCLLSLDGGGVRGLSSLYILKGLMLRLNDERERLNLPQVKPCDIFDLIGGTSTGGLIAIMLGRLEMDVDDCIAAYKTLMKTVFEKKRSLFSVGLTGKIKAQFSSKALEKAIKSVILARGLPIDEPFYVKVEDEQLRKCKVFVCVNAKETNHIGRLRAYRLHGRSPDITTIWEAALATSAAPTFFDPVQINGRTYVDGALGANNPSFEVEKEASNIWCEVSGKLEPLVKNFISIGTGNPGIKPVSDRAWKFVSESIVKVATETTETEEMFSSRWRGHLDTRYFRFNVEQGLQNLGIAEYKQMALILAATDEYLESHKTGPKVRACVLNLRTKRYPPNEEFCKDQAAAQEAQDRNGHQEVHLITPTEISELIERGNASLNRNQQSTSPNDLVEAYNTFARALRAKRQQTPPAPAKDLARLQQKLMSICLRLSYYPNFSASKRMSYVGEAGKFGKQALENAVKSRNDSRVAQMQFYLACVRAREIQLRMDCDEGVRAVVRAEERDAASVALSEALLCLRRLEIEDMSVYETMADEYLPCLEVGGLGNDGMNTSLVSLEHERGLALA